jgi:hypothetical protein
VNEDSVPIRVSCSSKLSLAFVLDEVFDVSFGRTVSLAVIKPGLQEVSVRNRIVQSVFLAAALFAVSVIPATAQTDAFSVGLALLSSNGGVGINADYSKATSTKANDRMLGWVGDVSFNHKGFNTLGLADFSVNTFMVDGGVRLAGKANEKATWHVQGTAGIAHAGRSVDTLTQSICDAVGIDCGGATSFLIMPSGALTYWFSDRGGLKGQLNIPILVTGNTGHAVRFDINYVMKLKK